MSFETLLTAFEQAAATRDVRRFAALFTPEGRYHDGFFGMHQGREAIAAMLERFHVGGERFAWQFLEPVGNERIGYARYCFSYVSKEPESAGQIVVFEGMARFLLEAAPAGGREAGPDGALLIADYDEVFDRGMAFVQLGYAGERVVKLLKRYAEGFRASPAVQAHLAWRERAGHPPAAG
ncbi:MAG: nuclear transport factor 2 family protein [Rubrivivax sp.]|nr:nuclear transport factor 2 family protein [Rubrivivax sp.]